MYLKKIEIQGFKSFADKTIVNFNDNITAIVGPNGSGKSNISDAIRWVLGEQSIKNLRGAKMEDVIFSGTDKRKALGYAEVSIYFNNKDKFIPIEYTEVCVTRRMFRSGESEYYINKNSCRLKDIRELFMDTGIGKDGYSIIGQGKIEEILSSRPEDRRNIYEEAAGIVKYKNKKIETEKKLNKTDDNLNRLKDIIFEISNQYEALEEDAKKTIEYNELYKNLKELEINLYLNKIYDLEKEKNFLVENIEKIDGDILLLTKDKNHIEDRFNSLKESIDILEANIENLRNEKESIGKQTDIYKNEKKILEEKNIYINKDLSRLEKEIEESTLNIKKYNEKVNGIKSKKYTIKSEKSITYSEFEKKNIEFEKMKLLLKDELNKLESEKNNLFNLKNNISDLKSRKNSLISFKDNIDKRLNQIQKDIAESQNIREESIEKKKYLSIDREKIKVGLNEEEKKEEKLSIEIENIENTIKSLEIEENKYKVSMQGLKSTLNLYKNMEDSYEGYYKSVKNLLMAIDKNKVDSLGFKGVIGELIKVDKKYEKAIEISLGSSIQNIITDTADDAKKFIEYLKRNNLGRVTFMPIETIRPNLLAINIEDTKNYGFLGLAYTLLEYPKKYENIFKNLLGKTIIIDNIDNAIKLAKKFNNKYRIVTLEGEIINPGGSLTGGSTTFNNTSIISRKNKIEEVENKIENLDADIKEIIVKRNFYFDELKKTKSKKVEVIEKKEKLRQNLIDNKNLLAIEENKILGQDKIINSKNIESKDLNSELEAFLVQNGEFDCDIVDLLDKVKALEIKINYMKNSIEEKNEEKDNLSKELVGLQININTLENRYKSLEEDLKYTSDLLGHEKELVIEKTNQYNTNKKDIKELVDELNLLKDKILKSEEKELYISEKLDREKKSKEDLMENFYKEQEVLKTINNKLMEVEKEKNNLEIKLTKGDVQLEIFNSKLWEEYEVSFQDYISYKKPIENISIVQKKINEYKKDIKKLGNINLNAVEEFNNIKERFNFITEQEADLLESKKDLIKLIKDMEKTMRVKFLEAFEDINLSFKEVFSILFNGGKASLELVDKDDILNSGIEIRVQPPGKKLQNLNLLSGGEKSLTAVALLFGILEIKPSPFCILDEIDAALDEANIGRYTSYLDKFSEKTQFVLITHRKTSMEICQVLYGVTMAEEGVSKLISLKMADLKKYKI